MKVKKNSKLTEIQLESNKEMSKLLRMSYDGEIGEWARVNDYGYISYQKDDGVFIYAVAESNINYTMFQHTSRLIARRAGCSDSDIDYKTDRLSIPDAKNELFRVAVFAPVGKTKTDK